MSWSIYKSFSQRKQKKVQCKAECSASLNSFEEARGRCFSAEESSSILASRSVPQQPELNKHSQSFLPHVHWDSTWQLCLKGYSQSLFSSAERKTKRESVCVCVLPVQEVRRQRPAICVSQFCLFPSFPPAALLARICITEVSSHTVSLIHAPRLPHCAVLYGLFVFLFERPFAQLTQ